MMILVRLEQELNVYFPILVTLLGMLILVRLQPWNAESPILVTLFGMLILVRLEQELNVRLFNLARTPFNSKNHSFIL